MLYSWMNRAIIQLSFDHVKVSVGCLLIEEMATKVIILVIFWCCFLLLSTFGSFLLEFEVATHGFWTRNRVAQYKILKYTYLTFFYIFFTQFYTKLVFGAKFKFSTFTRKLLAQWPISKLRYCSNPFYNHFFGAICNT